MICTRRAEYDMTDYGKTTRWPSQVRRHTGRPVYKQLRQPDAPAAPRPDGTLRLWKARSEIGRTALHQRQKGTGYRR
jgi:hypothetical protein